MRPPTELNRVLEDRYLHDFGVRDQEGRALGARIDRLTVELRREAARDDPTRPTEVRYIFEGRLARDGEPFGSGRTMLTYFDSRAERDEKIAQYLHYAGQRVTQRVRRKQAFAKAVSALAERRSALAKRKARRAAREETAALITAALIARLRTASA